MEAILATTKGREGVKKVEVRSSCHSSQIVFDGYKYIYIIYFYIYTQYICIYRFMWTSVVSMAGFG